MGAQIIDRMSFSSYITFPTTFILRYEPPWSAVVSGVDYGLAEMDARRLALWKDTPPSQH